MEQYYGKNLDNTMVTSRDEQQLEEAIRSYTQNGSADNLNTILNLLGYVSSQPPQNLQQLFKIIYDKDMDKEQKRQAAYEYLQLQEKLGSLPPV
jgi:hypothetical protein